MDRLIYKLATTSKELQGALEVRNKVFVEFDEALLNEVLNGEDS